MTQVVEVLLKTGDEMNEERKAVIQAQKVGLTVGSAAVIWQTGSCYFTAMIFFRDRLPHLRGRKLVTAESFFRDILTVCGAC